MYIDGEKIEISEETANNLKEKFSEKSPYEFNNLKETYILNGEGKVVNSYKYIDSYQKGAIKQGNIFRTREEAQHESNKRKAIFKIKKYIYDNFGYDPTDWADWSDDKSKIYITRWCSTDIYDVMFSYSVSKQLKCYSPIGYLKTEDQAQEIIKEFEKELKIIFNIK